MLKRWGILFFLWLTVWGMVWARGNAAATIPTADSSWATGFHLVGINGVVHSLALDTGQNFYVGGAFTIAGYTTPNNIAYWNGSYWQPLGSGLNGPVYHLAVGQNGFVFASGAFTMTGNIPVNHIAGWDGQQWLPLGSGVDLTNTILETDEAGFLYAAGDFTTIGDVPAQHIAQWDGNTWAALGSGIDGTVADVKSDDAGNVYVGGEFGLAGGMPIQNIARWDGFDWFAVGDEINQPVRAIVPWGGDRLYADTELFLYEWTGTHWTKYEHPHFNPLVKLPLAGNQKGDLYAIGTFSEGGGPPGPPYLADRVIRWRGTYWDMVGAEISLDSVKAMIVDEQNIVTIGGQISFVGTTPVNNVAQGWGGVNLWGLGGGSGLNYPVNGMTLDHQGNVYVGGWFTAAGDVPAKALARWNGGGWSAWEEILDGSVNAVAVADNGYIYAGGWLWLAFNFPFRIYNHIAVWNGNRWQDLGGDLDATVLALAFDPAGNLYAVGPFTSAGNHVAKWNGNYWSALGAGVDGEVKALAVDSQGQVYVGGVLSINGQDERVARWDGANWTVIPRPQQTDNGVLHLAVDANDRLYASFLPACPECAPTEYRLARWDGSTWTDLTGDLAYGFISATAFDCSGQLVAGGYFSTTGSNPANNVALWQETGWLALEEGITGSVSALQFNPTNNKLYVGGNFDFAGNHPSHHFAIWSAEPCQRFFVPLLNR